MGGRGERGTEAHDGRCCGKGGGWVIQQHILGGHTHREEDEGRPPRATPAAAGAGPPW